MLGSRSFLSLAVRRFSSRLNPVMNVSSDSLTTNTPLEEETSPGYYLISFYPTRVGQIIQKYQVLSKLGWGTGSTVWLAKDIKRFVQHLS